MRLFLDANVIFAASWKDGRARALFKLSRSVEPEIVLLTSWLALQEAKYNIKRKRPEALSTFQELRKLLTLSAEPSIDLIEKALALGLPKKDAPILAAAWSSNANILVTGDQRHFGHLMGKQIDNLYIIPLRESIRYLLSLSFDKKV